MVKLKDHRVFLREHIRVTELDNDERYILESIRFSDGDQSIKSGAILTFCGLIIATTVVQFSASPKSLLFLNNHLIFIDLVGLFFLFVSSFLSLIALTISYEYSKKPKEALQQFHKLVCRRAMLSKYSIQFCTLGSLFVLFVFFINVLINVH